jgi:hypothetical protein
MSMMRTLAALLLLPLLHSCCFLCGGDTRPLVPVTWEEPRSALETLLVAIENDDSRRIYQSLSPKLKQEQGIDGMAFAVGWEKLRQAQPFLHVAGQASVVQEKRVSPREHLYLMGVHGQRFTVKLEQLCYWEVLVQDEDERIRLGSYMDPALFEKRILNVAPDEGRILVEFKDEEILGVQKSDIRGLELSTEWKVRSFAEGEEGFPK